MRPVVLTQILILRPKFEAITLTLTLILTPKFEAIPNMRDKKKAAILQAEANVNDRRIPNPNLNPNPNPLRLGRREKEGKRSLEDDLR